MMAFIILLVLCQLVSNNNRANEEPPLYDSSLIQIDSLSFFSSIRSGVCFVLFYKPNSIPCENMEKKLDRLAKDRTKQNHFFKINTADRCNFITNQYNVSGVPNILIFKDGKEKKRIMGIISYSNLEMIYQREIK